MTRPADDGPFDPTTLPTVVVRYLEIQAVPAQRATLADLFDHDARVIDEGIEYAGIDAIRGWLGTTVSAYTYTTTLLGQRSDGDGRWVVSARLDGDFPGGVAHVRYRFATAHDRITDLVIAP